jgi:hypothetical protein
LALIAFRWGWRNLPTAKKISPRATVRIHRAYQDFFRRVWRASTHTFIRVVQSRFIFHFTAGFLPVEKL